VPRDTVTFSVYRCPMCIKASHHTVTTARRPFVGGGRCQDMQVELLTVAVDGVELQRDVKLPLSRGCASGYRIVDVFLTGDEASLVATVPATVTEVTERPT